MIEFKTTLESRLIGNKDIGEDEKKFIALMFNSSGEQLTVSEETFKALTKNYVIKPGFAQTSYAKIDKKYFHLTKTGRLYYLKYLNPVSLSSG